MQQAWVFLSCVFCIRVRLFENKCKAIRWVVIEGKEATRIAWRGAKRVITEYLREVAITVWEKACDRSLIALRMHSVAPRPTSLRRLFALIIHSALTVSYITSLHISFIYAQLFTIS